MKHSQIIIHFFVPVFVFVATMTNVQVAYAQQAPNFEKAPQLTKMFEAVISYPLPSWIEPPISLDQSEYYTNRQGASYLIEQVPKGEKFTAWNRLYAIHGVMYKNGKNINLDKYAVLNFGPLIKACGKENFFLQRIFQTKTSQTFLIVCQDTPHSQPGSGYGRGVGEVGIFRFIKFKNTLIKVYQEWRGKSFVAKDKMTWPVSQEELKTMVKRFAYIKAVPALR